MAAAPDDRQRALAAELASALPGDPFVVHDLDAGSLERIATRPGQAVAALSVHSWRGVRWLTGLAADPASADDVAAAVRLVVAVAGEAAAAGEAVTGVTVPRGGRDLLPDALRPPDVEEWDYWFTLDEPPTDGWTTTYAVQPAVTDVPGDDPRLAALLAVASPHAPIRPGDPRVGRWAVIEDPEGGLPGTGGLAAMLAVTHMRSGSAHLNDVATHPDRRGRRLARLLCGQVTVDALREGRPAVTLGMYADNDAARAVYTGLGFTCLRGNTSGSLAPAPATHH